MSFHAKVREVVVELTEERPEGLAVIELGDPVISSAPGLERGVVAGLRLTNANRGAISVRWQNGELETRVMSHLKWLPPDEHRLIRPMASMSDLMK